eukprot:5126097-Heterocapsa_arctica.AAC.1
MVRLEEEFLDKSDTEDNTGVINNIKIYQNSIDQRNDRDRHEENQLLKIINVIEEREHYQTKLTHNRRYNNLRGMTLRLKDFNRTRNPGQRRSRLVKTF